MGHEMRGYKGEPQRHRESRRGNNRDTTTKNRDYERDYEGDEFTKPEKPRRSRHRDGTERKSISSRLPKETPEDDARSNISMSGLVDRGKQLLGMRGSQRVEKDEMGSPQWETSNTNQPSGTTLGMSEAYGEYPSTEAYGGYPTRPSGFEGYGSSMIPQGFDAYGSSTPQGSDAYKFPTPQGLDVMSQEAFNIQNRELEVRTSSKQVQRSNKELHKEHDKHLDGYNEYTLPREDWQTNERVRGLIAKHVKFSKQFEGHNSRLQEFNNTLEEKKTEIQKFSPYSDTAEIDQQVEQNQKYIDANNLRLIQDRNGLVNALYRSKSFFDNSSGIVQREYNKAAEDFDKYNRREDYDNRRSQRLDQFASKFDKVEEMAKQCNQDLQGFKGYVEQIDAEFRALPHDQNTDERLAITRNIIQGVDTSIRLHNDIIVQIQGDKSIITELRVL